TSSTEPKTRLRRIRREANPRRRSSPMRFIPTKFHAPLDHIVGAALIAAPWIFRFSEHTAATVVPIILGIGLIAYSLVTNYELGVWKVAPMAVDRKSTRLNSSHQINSYAVFFLKKKIK